MLGAVLVSLCIIANCRSATDGVPVTVSSAPQKTVESPTPKVSILSSDEIRELREYAESFEPRSGREVIPSPPVLPEKISTIIAKAASANSREHEKFVLLVFVRISRFQIENFRQRYELGRTNLLTKEFYRLVGRKDFKAREANLAYLADIYIEEYPELRQYALIDAEMQRITKMGERIESDLNKLKAKGPIVRKPI